MRKFSDWVGAPKALSNILITFSWILVFNFLILLPAGAQQKIVLSPALSMEVEATSVRIFSKAIQVPTITLLTNPPRCVVDLPGLDLSKPQTRKLMGHPKFLAVRAAGHKDYVRLVFDLNDEMSSPPGQKRFPGGIMLVFTSKRSVSGGSKAAQIEITSAPIREPRVITPTRLPTRTPTLTPTPVLQPTKRIVIPEPRPLPPSANSYEVPNAELKFSGQRIDLSGGLIAYIEAGVFKLQSEVPISPELELLENPPRYVVNLPGIGISRKIVREINGHQFITALRTGAHPTFTSIVLDFHDGKVEAPKIKKTSKDLFIYFKAAAPSDVTDNEPVDLLAAKATSLPIPIPTAILRITPTATIAVERAEPQEELEELSFDSPKIPARTPVPWPASVFGDLSDEDTATPENIEESSVRIAPPTIKEAALRFSVSALVINFPFDKRPIKDVVVKNRSESVLFMTAVVEQVLNAGLPSESRVSSKNLLVSPKHFELTAGQERNVRLVVAGRKNSNEEVYRINFIPDDQPFDPKISTSKSPVINTGLSILALLPPESPTAQLSWDWDDDLLVLTNSGNSNIYLDRIKACKPDRCVGLPTKRLYAKNSWSIKMQGATRLELLQKTGEDFENVVIRRKPE